MNMNSRETDYLDYFFQNSAIKRASLIAGRRSEINGGFILLWEKLHFV